MKPTQPTACNQGTACGSWPRPASLRQRGLIRRRRRDRLLELGQRRRNRRIALEHGAGVAAGDFLVATQVPGQQDLGGAGGRLSPSLYLRLEPPGLYISRALARI